MTPPAADGHRRDDSQASYYFVSHEVGTSGAVRDAGDEGEVIEEMPAGTNPDIFSPRIVNAIGTENGFLDRSSKSEARRRQGRGGFFSGLFGRNTRSAQTPKRTDIFEGGKKVDPKIFFSNERTFLAWMHAAVLLAGVSVAMSATADSGSASEIYGLMILPVAIVFVIYSMVQYAKRSYMISTRSPGPFEDRWGPVIVGSIFVASILAQFFVKLYELV